MSVFVLPRPWEQEMAAAIGPGEMPVRKGYVRESAAQ